MTNLDIYPGMKLVCSHVRLVQNLDHLSTSHTGRLVFLTTTAESQVHRLACLRKKSRAIVISRLLSLSCKTFIVAHYSKST